MRKILLIGGAGYIGTVLTKHFLSNGFKVKCFDALIYSQKTSLSEFYENNNFEFILGDIRNLEQVKNSLNDVSIVVVLAGLVGDFITKKYPEEASEINNKAIKDIIDSCNKRNINRLVFVSTCSNYGLLKNDEVADENHELNPLSSYAKDKVEIENYLMSLKNKVDFSPTILRFATAFGLSPRMRFDLTINHFTKAILEKQLLNIYDAHTWRPYCHVNDFARLIEKIIFAEKEKIHFQIFNSGSNINNYTKETIINEIVKIIPSKNFIFGKDGPDQRNYKVNFDKVKKILNFEVKYTIQHGIKEIYKAIELGFFTKTKEDFDKLGNFKISL
jgi:nucleoside-diphosphate-sugar epimerase|tara:strand:+ start:150 stop:1142 length:993 start_codon:yes stop_codon:yes gene_type:complete